VTRANGFSEGQGARRAPRRGYANAAALDEALAPIAMAFPQGPKRPRLWRRIEAAVDAADSAGRPAAVVRREEGWRQYSRDVQIKRLWDRNTFLMRCAPGGVLPAHKHRRFEHCIVLEGDMIVGGETYRSGDYHGVPAHVAHNEITSRTGLLMLVRYQ
jgi:anti-sigma factor ChrR (cupin superfamily)